MAETIRSILCGKHWKMDSRSYVRIEFFENGTGEMIFYGSAMNVFIAAETDWSVTNPDILDQTVHQGDTSGTSLLAEFNLNLTLTKRALPDNAEYTINEARLEESAFRPKSYNVRLERGSFISPHDMIDGRVSPLTKRYEFRLACDKTLYPPTEDWKPYWLPMRNNEIEGWKDFYAGTMELGDEFEVWDPSKHSESAKRRTREANGVD
ncbi:hypothetical protein MauCBS54593_006936 [Microsporum audouinii]